MIPALGAGAALLIAVLFGLRALGFNRKSRIAAGIVILGWIIFRRNFLLPFQIEDWWLWFAGCLLALLPATVLGDRWLSPPRLWTVLDLCALGSLVGTFLDFYPWFRAEDPLGIVVTVAFAAIGALALSEFGRTRVSRRPAGVVTGEIMLTLGALCGAISYSSADHHRSTVHGFGTMLLGGVLIAARGLAVTQKREVRQ